MHSCVLKMGGYSYPLKTSGEHTVWRRKKYLVIYEHSVALGPNHGELHYSLVIDSF